jgi:hypothetical protein
MPKAPYKIIPARGAASRKSEQSARTDIWNESAAVQVGSLDFEVSRHPHTPMSHGFLTVLGISAVASRQGNTGTKKRAAKYFGMYVGYRIKAGYRIVSGI